MTWKQASANKGWATLTLTASTEHTKGASNTSWCLSIHVCTVHRRQTLVRKTIAVAMSRNEQEVTIPDGKKLRRDFHCLVLSTAGRSCNKKQRGANTALTIQGRQGRLSHRKSWPAVLICSSSTKTPRELSLLASFYRDAAKDEARRIMQKEQDHGKTLYYQQHKMLEKSLCVCVCVCVCVKISLPMDDSASMAQRETYRGGG